MSHIKLSKKEFEAKLVKEFPNLYANMYGDMRHTCMSWGIDSGPGWYDLIYDLSSNLEKIIINLPEEGRKNYKAEQIKQKFAELRFYMTSETEEISKLIGEAEKKSRTTCEVCGQPGECVGNFWMYVACKDHTKDKDKKKSEEKTDA